MQRSRKGGVTWFAWVPLLVAWREGAASNTGWLGIHRGFGLRARDRVAVSASLRFGRAWLEVVKR